MALLFALLPSMLVSLALILAERRLGRHRLRQPGDSWLNLQAWAVNLATMLLVLPLVPAWRGPALINAAGLPFWAGFALFLVTKDAAEYAYHRAQHAIPWLWAMHAFHHSDPAMATLTTQRHFWGDQLIKQATIWSAALMLVSPTPAIVFAYGMVSLWNTLAHADIGLNFGRYSWLLNSPAYHRRHHSALPEHFNSNFAALLPIFDVICGSYYRPEGRPPTGLDRRPHSLGEALVWPLIWQGSRPLSRAAPSANGR